MADKAALSLARAASAFSFRPDPLVHARIRLGILSALAASGQVSFADLKSLLATTDGNLSVHARKLEVAGYIECSKSFANRLPRTEYRLTGKGRRAFEKYLDEMERILALARQGT